MSYSPPPVREEELHAFVDDRLDPGRRAEIERLIAAEPALRRRLEGWARQADGLREALPLPGPTPPSLNVTMLMEQRLSRRRSHWRIAAGVALVFAVGAGAGAGGMSFMQEPIRPTEIARLRMEATSAYRVFATDVKPIEVSAADPSALRSWMDQRLGRTVALPDLSAQGYHLLGARMLAAMYGPAAMLIYEDEAGTRLTVYMQPMKLGREAAMERVAMGAVNGFAWISDKIGYSVLGDDADDGLHGIANKLQAATKL